MFIGSRTWYSDCFKVKLGMHKLRPLLLVVRLSVWSEVQMICIWSS